MSQCLVTGGAGFIGSNLVRYLLRHGQTVAVLDDLSTGSLANLADVRREIRFCEGDIRDADCVRQAMHGADYVFHQAALPSVSRSVEDPLTSNEVNITGTLNVLLAARDAKVKRVVLAASSSAYGNTPTLPKVETMPGIPLSPYAVTKYVLELYAQVFSRVYGLETVCLRYFNVFGPGQSPQSQYAAVIPRFLAALLNNEAPVIYGDGEQTRDFTYIDNVVAANWQAALAPAERVAGQVFNIGGGGRVSLNALLAEMQRLLGTQITPQYAPARPGDVRDSQADISKAREAFGYEPCADLAEGLRATIDWFQRGSK